MTTKQIEKSTARKWRLPFPAAVYLILVVTLDEILLHLWTVDALDLQRLGMVALFALSGGTVLGALVNLLPRWLQKPVAVLVGLAITLLCMLEYGLREAFQVFMPLSVVSAGAGGVATDFGDTVQKLLSANLWRIAILLAPILLYLLFTRTPKPKLRWSGLLALQGAVLYALTLFVAGQIPGYTSGLSTTYSFDNAVRDYGLHVALVLEEIQQEEGTFFVEEPPLTEPITQPTQPTQPTDQPEENTEPPVVYVPQVLDVDFAALAQSESNKDVANIHSYVASRTPTMTNAYTGLFEGKNLILITAEAFTGAWLDPQLTPTLWRMVHEGIYFTDYYQPLWGASTTGGEYSNVVGLVPNSGKCMQEATQQDLFLTMGNQLQALGYASAAYHNNSYTYYNRHQTHTSLGYDVFIGMGNGMEAGVTNVWPQSDQQMFDFTIGNHLDNQPFSLYYMSVSGHSEYSQGGNAMSRKNYNIVAGLNHSEALKCYIAANLELEYAMTSLLAQLEEAGIADDTVIAISSDHYPYGLDQSDAWGTSESYLSELFGEPCDSRFVRDQNALILWSGCVEDLDIVVDTPVSSLDLLPTLSNLFGVAYDSRLLPGRDVFSDAAPLVFWPDYSWKTDKGVYNSSTRTFTPNEGVTVEEGYVERISRQVSNHLTYSKAVQTQDYFNYVSAALQ